MVKYLIPLYSKELNQEKLLKDVCRPTLTCIFFFYSFDFPFCSSDCATVHAIRYD